MLQSWMRQIRIRLATAFHATCYKFLSSMLHATRMNVFIFVACSMQHIFNVVFVWPHPCYKIARKLPNDARKRSNKSSNFSLKFFVFLFWLNLFAHHGGQVCFRSFLWVSWRTGMLQKFPVSLMTPHDGGQVCFRSFLWVSWLLICWRGKDIEEKKDFNKYKKVEWKEHDAFDWLAGRKTFTLRYVW